jgi:hypothetical protein
LTADAELLGGWIDVVKLKSYWMFIVSTQLAAYIELITIDKLSSG